MAAKWPSMGWAVKTAPTFGKEQAPRPRVRRLLKTCWLGCWNLRKWCPRMRSSICSSGHTEFTLNPSVSVGVWIPSGPFHPNTYDIDRSKNDLLTDCRLNGESRVNSPLPVSRQTLKAPETDKPPKTRIKATLFGRFE